MRGIKNVTHTGTHPFYLDQTKLSGNVTFCVTWRQILTQVEMKMGCCISTGRLSGILYERRLSQTPSPIKFLMLNSHKAT